MSVKMGHLVIYNKCIRWVRTKSNRHSIASVHKLLSFSLLICILWSTLFHEWWLQHVIGNGNFWLFQNVVIGRGFLDSIQGSMRSDFFKWSVLRIGVWGNVSVVIVVRGRGGGGVWGDRGGVGHLVLHGGGDSGDGVLRVFVVECGVVYSISTKIDITQKVNLYHTLLTPPTNNSQEARHVYKSPLLLKIAKHATIVPL